MRSQSADSHTDPLFLGPGEMRALSRAFDWAATSLGLPTQWPQSLRTTAQIVLASSFPTILLWGPDLIQLYNDGYRELMGNKHPAGLGQPTQQCWPEVWHINKPLYQRVWMMESFHFEDALYPITRSGQLQDAWFTLAYSPVLNEAGQVSGVLVTVFETTTRILEQRYRQEAQFALSEKEKQQAFLLKLSDAMRSLDEPLALQQTAMRVLGEYLQVNRAFYGQLLADDDTLLMGPGYVHQLPSLAGTLNWAAFDSEWANHYRAGQPLIIEDLQQDVHLSAQTKATFESIQVQAAVSVPLVKNNKVRAILSIHQAVPRHWTQDEIGLLEETAERIWTAVEQARVAQALRKSEEQFRLLGIASSDSLYRMSADWTQMHQLTGKTFLADTTNSSSLWLMTYIPPEDQSLVQQVIQEAIRTKSPFELEHRVLRADGIMGWTFSRAVPMLDAQGAIQEWLGAASDITVRKQAEEALRQADRRKDEFLAMLAHELRNPMSTLRSGLQILRLTAGWDQTSSATLALMNRQTDHLVRLVDDLLDVSRISQGKIELKRERLELGALVRASIDAIRPQFDTDQKSLRLSMDPSAFFVNGDATRLTQVVTNLLTNGLRYTGPQGQVWVSLGQQNGEALLRVSDNGIGLSADQLTAIFELFVQADNSFARSLGGLGIGLTLARRLVDLHGGRIVASSPGLKQGSTFTVSLPLIEAPTTEPALEGIVARSRPTQRLLVIDDNADAALTLSMLLKLAGYEVQRCLSGREGIQVAESVRPAVILCDIGMPDLDGYETCRQIRKQTWGSSMVLIALTGYGQAEDKQRVQAAGFNAHLLKPVDLETLLALLTKFLPTS